MNDDQLFARQVGTIRVAAAEIAADTQLLSRLHGGGPISYGYDLAISAKNLREAADLLEAIYNRSMDHAV